MDDAHGRPVVVEGLKEFRLACLALQENKDFVHAMKRVADIVVEGAQARIPVDTGAAQRSIRSRAAGAGARVIWGGTKAIYMPWLEFGGRKHGNLKGKTTGRTQPADRQRIAIGRYVYPSIERNRDKVEEQVIVEMNTLVRRYGMVVDE